MVVTSNNCITFTKNPELIGKLVMEGYKVHYNENIQDLIDKIGELYPDLLIQHLWSSFPLDSIDTLLQIQGYILIRGQIPKEIISKNTQERILLFPKDIKNDEIIDSIKHLNDSIIVKNHTGKPTILIIEDNPDILELYSVAFTSRGYDTSLATDGLSGMTKAVNVRPDVIILDIMMPHMDGFEVLQALRNNTSLDATIVVNTNLEGVNEEKRVRELGADYFLRKSSYSPLDVITFIENEILHTDA